jgi:hypothetical protein
MFTVILMGYFVISILALAVACNIVQFAVLQHTLTGGKHAVQTYWHVSNMKYRIYGGLHLTPAP